MKLMFTGGSANGKSTLAERLAIGLPGPHYYLAAMKPYGPEALVRIQRHRASHDRKGFQTIERYQDLDALSLPSRGTLLLECLCNLLDNEFADHPRQVVPHILRGLEHLGSQCENLIVVTNDVGSDWPQYPDSTLEYQTDLGKLNCLAARTMDAVVEVTAGIPRLLFGKLPASVQEVLRDCCADTLIEANTLQTGTVIGPGKMGDSMEGAQGTYLLENSGKKAIEWGKERDCAMLLVIGAEASGKRDYVKSLGYTEKEISSSLWDDLPVLDGLHHLIARDPLNSQDWLPRLLEKKVVICNEVGSGIIPASEEARACREQTGRMCVLLAQKAERVVRMVCGIPIVLK